MSDDFLLCRALGHAWGALTMGYGVTDRAGVEQTNWAFLRLECERCGMRVERHVDAFFGLVDSTYSQPEGYAVTGQGAGHYRAEARRELLVRFAGKPPRARRRSPRHAAPEAAPEGNSR